MTPARPELGTAPTAGVRRQRVQLGVVGVACCAMLVAGSVPSRVALARRAADGAAGRLSALRDSLREFDLTRLQPHHAESDRDSLLAMAFSASSPDAEAAMLAAYVGDASRRVGLSVQAVESEPDRATTSGLGSPRVRLTGTSDASGLVQFLLLLELRERLVRTVELRVEASDVFAAPSVPEQLRVVVLVEGVALRHRDP